MADDDLTPRTALRGQRLAGYALVAVVCAQALVQGWHSLRDVHHAVRDGQALTDMQRHAPPRPFDYDVRVLVAAAKLIPRESTFAVVTGNAVPVSSPDVLPAMPSLAGYYLLPRREVGAGEEPAWIVSYGGDLGALGLRYRRVVRVAPGLAVAEVRP